MRHSFRWATLIIQELKSIAGMPGKVRQRLKALPESLEVLYKGCLDAIAPVDRADVRRLLLWLVRAVRPLSLDDFADLMSFDYTDDKLVYDASLRPVPTSVISMVGLMLVSVNGKTVQLAHASVRDFILNLPSDSPFYVRNEEAYVLMARTCIAYLAGAGDAAHSWNVESQLTWSWVNYIHKAGIEVYNCWTSGLSHVMTHASHDGHMDTRGHTLRHHMFIVYTSTALSHATYHPVHI